MPVILFFSHRENLVLVLLACFSSLVYLWMSCELSSGYLWISCEVSSGIKLLEKILYLLTYMVVIFFSRINYDKGLIILYGMEKVLF